MKKRIISLFLALILIISVGTVTVNADSLEDLQSKITKITDIDEIVLTSLLGEMKKSFKDTNQNAWYAKHVAKILGIKGINGYPDGTFRPNGTITRAEFTKILIAALYGEQTNEECATHWACAYVKKAEDIGILNKDEFTLDNIDKPITRQEIARMISLALQKSLGESITANLSDIERLIKDSNTFNAEFKNHILNAYSKGIITGYPDKTFGATKTATRAEASTMLVRLLDAKEREKVSTGYKTVDDLGYASQPIENFGITFKNNYGTERYPATKVIVIKKSDLPLQMSKSVVVHDIGLSADKKHILLIQENSTNDHRLGVVLAIKNEGFRSRSDVEYYEKSLGNNKYQTTSYVNSIADKTPITVDMIEFIVFGDLKNNRFIAIEREDALGE